MKLHSLNFFTLILRIIIALNGQFENDFISEVLLKLHPTISKVHTDGIGFRNNWNEAHFIWQHNGIPIDFKKWWPGTIQTID